MTLPDVLPIRQCTFPYSHHTVSHRVGYTIRCLFRNGVVRTGFEPVQLVCLLERVLPMVATHTLRLPISPPDYIGEV